MQRRPSVRLDIASCFKRTYNRSPTGFGHSISQPRFQVGIMVISLQKKAGELQR